MASSVALVEYVEGLRPAVALTACVVVVLCGRLVVLVSRFESLRQNLAMKPRLVSNLSSSCLHHQVWGFRCMPPCQKWGDFLSWLYIRTL